MSTLSVPQIVPSATEDCEQLRNAFAGWGTNEKLIISILGHRTAAQRYLIRKTYSEIYEEDLLKALQKELRKDFERALILLILDTIERDALLVNEAIKKWNTKDHVLIEISCARSSRELLLVRESYHHRFKRSIEEDIAPLTTSGFRKLLVGLISSYRYGGVEVDEDLAKSEAQLLHDKITGNAVNHEEVIRILTTRSKPQLKATFNHYKDTFGNFITEDLKADPKDEFLSALRATINCLVAPEIHFAEVIQAAINKTGTDEDALTRVVITRAEVDMQQIKEEFLTKSGVALDKAIAKDTSGPIENKENYKDAWHSKHATKVVSKLFEHKDSGGGVLCRCWLWA